VTDASLPADPRRSHALDAAFVQNLSSVVARTGARVVLSSARRRDPASRKHAENVLASRGVIVAGWTEGSRAADILRWIEKHDRNVASDIDLANDTNADDRVRAFVVVDERPLVREPGGEALVGRFVMTSPGTGLISAAAEAVSALFQNQETSNGFASDDRNDSRASGDSSRWSRGSCPERENGAFSRSASPRSGFRGCTREMFSRETSRSSKAFRGASPSLSRRSSLESSGDDAPMFDANRAASRDVHHAADHTNRRASEVRMHAPRMSVEGTSATFSPPRKKKLTPSRNSAYGRADSPFRIVLGDGARFLWDDSRCSTSSRDFGEEDTVHVVRYGCE